MKDEYLIWKRIEDSLIQLIKDAKKAVIDNQNNIEVNKFFLFMTKRKIKELERAGKIPQKKLK